MNKIFGGKIQKNQIELIVSYIINEDIRLQVRVLPPKHVNDGWFSIQSSLNKIINKKL